ncbi:MAG: Do family serine endopeptidase [Hyphomicrobiales bacterium]|nr:Do family serine endopeptidase [Hyphomicrobiales bacterium]
MQTIFPIWRKAGAILLLAAICSAFFSQTQARAQEITREIPSTQAEIQLSYAPLVKRAAPAVVNIYSSRKVRVRSRFSPFMEDPFFNQFFDKNLFLGPLKEKVVNSLGSGVIVDPKGLIITNFHVVQDSEDIKVVLNDRREFDAEVVLRDEKSDLALLRIAPKEALPYLPLSDDEHLQVGDLVLAIGNPFGVGQTVTSGIVSALARTTVGVADYQFFIQTDAAINPGNSGGALIDMQGRLVGVPSAIYSKTGGSLGIGFAIPATMVRSILHSHISGGRVVRPWLGAGGQDVTADIADSLGLERPVGVLITDVHPESMAAQAGIKVGDIITKLGSHTIPDGQTLRFRIATGTLGEVVPITILRDGQAQTLHITLLPPPENVPREETALKGDHPLSGATIANLSPVIADELSLDAVSGVVILAVERGSTAARLGLSEGDIIANINNQRMESVQEVGSAVAKPQREWVLKIKRGPQVLTLTLRL